MTSKYNVEDFIAEFGFVFSITFELKWQISKFEQKSS